MSGTWKVQSKVNLRYKPGLQSNVRTFFFLVWEESTVLSKGQKTDSALYQFLTMSEEMTQLSDSQLFLN